MKRGYFSQRQSIVTLLMGVLWLTGCANPAAKFDTDANGAAPPDFALVFTVAGDDAGDDAALNQPSQTVIEPTRVMRVSLGSGATADYFPTLTRTLSPRAFDAVHRKAHEVGLLEMGRRGDSKSVAGSASGGAGVPPAGAGWLSEVLYEIELHAHGKVRLIRTTPDAMPAARELLRLLVTLRQPPAVTQ